MSLSVEIVERLKKVRQKDEYLVSGFIKYNSLIDIPLEIIQICIIFFMCMDAWDTKNKSKWMEISGINDQICECTNPDDNPGNNYQTVLGILSVNSGKHHWKFKITNIDFSKRAYARISFGIVKTNKFNDKQLTNLVNGHMAQFEDKSFVIIVSKSNEDQESVIMDPHSCGSALAAYGECCNKVGDVIDMYLDLDKDEYPTLCFAMNGKNYGDIFRSKDYDHGIQIEKTDYKMGMSLSRIGTAVELLSYQQIDTIPDKD